MSNSETYQECMARQERELAAAKGETERLQARIEELSRPLGELIAAWVEVFGEISVDYSADRLDRAMAAVVAALAHCERNVGT